MNRKIKVLICNCTKEKLCLHGIDFFENRKFRCDCKNNEHKGYYVLMVLPCEQHNYFSEIFFEFLYNCSYK